jgi:hypothetical protein
MFLANDLHKHFYELQIQPVQDKKGVIAFRSVKELTNPQKDSDAEKEKQSLCLIIAYYYTRIFQIYGALALTLIDDAAVTAKSGMLSLSSESSGSTKLLAPGHSSQHVYGGASGGGYPVIKLGNFEFLRKYLTDDGNLETGFKTRYVSDSDINGVVYFKEGEPGVFQSTNTRQRGLFILSYKGALKLVSFEVLAEKQSTYSQEVKVAFGKIKYYKKGISDYAEVPSSVIQDKTITIESKGEDYHVKGSDLPLHEYLSNLFNRLFDYIQTTVVPTTDANGQPATTSSSKMSEEGTAEKIRLGKIIINLTRDKPMGHCIARALQLLSAKPFGDKKEFETYICKAQFLQSSTATDGKLSRSGLPIPGESIESSPGLAALAFLFYDNITIGSPKLTMKDSSLKQYITFMKRMAKLFEGADDLSQERLDQGLHAVKDTRDAKICKDKTGAMPVPPSVTGKIRQTVNALFKTQLVHAGDCGRIFKLLFDIERDKETGRTRISLSQNIIKKGFPEIERINHLARGVLINYYSTCETKYLLGMKEIIIAHDAETKVIAEKKAKENAEKRAIANAALAKEAAAAELVKEHQARQALAAAELVRQKQAREALASAELVKQKQAREALASAELVKQQNRQIAAELAKQQEAKKRKQNQTFWKTQ